jgi:hypothetical protein
LFACLFCYGTLPYRACYSISSTGIYSEEML